jgi:hypothetical protein
VQFVPLPGERVAGLHTKVSVGGSVAGLILTVVAALPEEKLLFPVYTALIPYDPAGKFEKRFVIVPEPELSNCTVVTY